MAALSDFFDASASFDPAGDLDIFLKQLPARWAVYLVADADARPVQLLCVKNLRASLKRRLGGEEPAGPSRRINYRDLLRQVYWRRVDSAFESDWIYLEAARALFPATYRALLGQRPAWFVHVDPAAPFPRFTRTNEPSAPAGHYFGPLEDKHAASRLIQLIEDAFDLCRYYNILLEAPHGKACAYKEMNRCDAPCDGSVTMEIYRARIDAAAEALRDPGAAIALQSRAMHEAAQSLQFEKAGRLKARIDLLSQLRQAPYRHLRDLAQFSFLSLQPGPRPSLAKLFLITLGQIDLLLGLTDLDAPPQPSVLLRHILESAAQRPFSSLDAPSLERLGLVSQHLYSPRKSLGLFLPLADIDDRSLVKALADFRRQTLKAPPEDAAGDAEGILRELNSLG